MIWRSLAGTDPHRGMKVGECREAKWHFDEVSIAPRFNTELMIQGACIKRVAYDFQAVAVAIPNGTYIASMGGRMKARKEGLATGFPDLMIIGYGLNERRVAYAEIKAQSQPKYIQGACLTWLDRVGYDCGVFRSQDTLADWLAGKGWQ